jgi:hypothetical protein
MKGTAKTLLVFATALIISGLLTARSPAGEARNEDACKKKEKEGCKGEHSYSFKFSGYFKADAAYDETRIYPGDYALRVMKDEDNNVMSMTARETRMGLDFWWKESDIRTDAKLEFDFYGVSAAENKAGPMLRHAYIKLTKGRWSLLAGQTSDVISPLVPKTVNYTVAWSQGNIGYRRPQIRVSTAAKLCEKAKLIAALAATRTLGSDLDGDGIDDGADAALPTVQGRLAVGANVGESGGITVGVSGHYGIEKYGPEDSLETVSKSFNVDVMLILSKKISLSGEFFVGDNLGTYFGGALQSVNRFTNREISTIGGWGMLSFKPSGKVTLNAGYAWDDPREEDLYIPSGDEHSFINMNSVMFGNVMYALTGNVTAMLELSQLKTRYFSKDLIDTEYYYGNSDYDAMRVQFALKAALK